MEGDRTAVHHESTPASAEIIAELPKLKPEELRLVREKLSELDAAAASLGIIGRTQENVASVLSAPAAVTLREGG
jgi:hypothetical protein